MRLWCCWDICTITFLKDLRHLIGFLMCSTPESLGTSFLNYSLQRWWRRAVQLLLHAIQCQLTFSAKINMNTYLPTSPPLVQPQSLLSVHSTKRQWGNGWILTWGRIFKTNTVWGSDLAFSGSWRLSSIWCFWNPQIFKCSSVCFSTQTAGCPEKWWPILIPLHSLSLPFQSSLVGCVDVRGQSSILLLFFKHILNSAYCNVQNRQCFGRLGVRGEMHSKQNDAIFFLKTTTILQIYSLKYHICMIFV